LLLAANKSTCADFLCANGEAALRACTNGEAALRAQAVAAGSVEVPLSFPIHGLPVAALFSRARDPWQCAAMECWLVLACQYMHRHLVEGKKWGHATST
ncbi:MAG: hypothetical protein ACPIOQ_29520, partial [Promethearchaeia archaeon]